MKEYLKYNLNSYLYNDSQKYKFLWLVPLVLFFLCIYYTYQKEVYVINETTAEVICNQECTLHTFNLVNNPLTYDFIKINNQKYEVDEILFGDSVLDSQNNAIQEIILKVKEYKGNNHEFVKLQIFKNKEKLLKKIYNIMKER